MKYTNSIHTPNQSGKLGAVIFSRNHYGAYSCMRSIPLDPNTPAQQTSRSGTAKIARLWTMLTPEQRTKWSEQTKHYQFTKKGRTYFLTPFMFFMKLNKNLYEVGAPLLKDFPSGQLTEPQTYSIFSVEMVPTPTSTDLLMVIDPAISGNTKLSLFATMPVKNSELYGTHKRFKIAVLDSSFVSGSSIKDFYFQKYNQLPETRFKVFFEIKSTNLHTGFSSTPKSCETYGL